MDTFHQLKSTAIKAAALATFLIWFLNMQNNFESIMLLLVIVSFIPIFIVCYIMILISIVPFYTYNNNLKNHIIFNKYFPIYAITFFVICSFIAQNNQHIFLYKFLITAFLTAMQSWIWFFKKKLNENK